jgi:hypothetical protein
MSEAMRQMLEQSGREGVARGEAAGDLFSDEANGPPHEHRGTGLIAQMAGHMCFARSEVKDLKLSNRPVRTRMPGGVGGAGPVGSPLSRSPSMGALPRVQVPS